MAQGRGFLLLAFIRYFHGWASQQCAGWTKGEQALQRHIRGNHTQTQAHTDTHKHTHIDTETDMNTHMHRHTQAHTDRHRHVHSALYTISF